MSTIAEPKRFISSKGPQVCWKYVTRKVNEIEEDHESGGCTTRVSFYNDHASTYDKDMLKYLYQGPDLTAAAIHRFLKGDVTKSILDVGGGSGLVVEKLRKFGAYNNVDGLDPAKALLQMGLSKGYYKNIFAKYFYNGCGVEANSYDALCCCGALVPGHIKSASLREMCNIVRPGGAVIIVMAGTHMVQDEDLCKVRPTAEELVKEKKWEIVEDFQVDQYFSDRPGQVFVFKKL